ncbi:MAG: 4-hydroxybenzoate octaprenyltransferase [Acidobacteria bacterium]|nr:4-hydroxybenzoate octaprenyltransferase [Acidobacteriota bacterium]|tara:strand:- start:2434 stop:3285 length:852 start_codon:yes stop_codon:yes gene_type:complete
MLRLRLYLSFVRFGHTVFALPFALVGALLASQQYPITMGRAGWIIAAMVTARTAAMGFNRLVDARFDALNPRTADRELPRGALKGSDAVVLIGVSSVAFVLVTTQLGLLCLVLSPVALVIVFWYSLAKRYTAFTQLFLGLALAVAPVGGWLAAGGRGGLEPWLLALGTGAWVAGFDIFYACQDLEFDRANGLQSIPARFGVQRSLIIARCLHVVTVLALAAVVLVVPLGWVYLAGVTGVALLLIYEQSLVRADDLSRVKQAFDLNGYVGFFYLMTTTGAVYVG